MTGRWMTLAATCAITLMACGPSQELQQRLADLEAVAAEKDSLLVLVTENARAMAEIGATIADVESADQQQAVLRASPESPIASSRDSLVARVRGVTDRLTEAEGRLAESRRRIRALGQRSDSLSGSVQVLEGSVMVLEEALATQRATVEELNQRVLALQVENEMLASDRARLADSVHALETEAQTVYYVIGTEDELMERGLVTREGGARFLFIFGRRGETLVPARDLDPSAFTAIDARQVTEIPLPDSAARYRIASRQDTTALETPIDHDGTITSNALRIADPAQFWRGSRYLIVVRRG